jgi:hypothetical protein
LEWLFRKIFLNEQGATTTLSAEIETSEEYKDMMDRAFQQGFAIVKSLAEQNH